MSVLTIGIVRDCFYLLIVALKNLYFHWLLKTLLLLFKEATLFGSFIHYYENLNSNLLPLYITYKSSGEKLSRYQYNLSHVTMFLILITTLFHIA